MSTTFFSLPREVRDQIYEPLVSQQGLIGIYFERDQETLPLELLLTNKTVCREATELFYARNRFDFTMGISEDIASFFGRIGPNNANHIQHIRLDFPRFLCFDFDNVTLEDNSIAILASIRSSCANLISLTISVDSTHGIELRLEALDGLDVATEALNNVVTEAVALVNTHLRAVPSLRDIIVEVYEDSLSDHVRREMRNHGWSLSIREYEEEYDIFGGGGGWDTDSEF